MMNVTGITLSILLTLLILVTVIGNVFVITAIIIERNLRTVGNYLVFSLAIADLTVACLVMPIGAINEVTGIWIFGPMLCDFWTCLDVLSCTASILHLVAIALDRYWAVTNVHYVTSRSSRSIGMLIASVWMVATIVSVAPIIGWKDENFHKRITEDKQCIISQDVAYQIMATCTSFYAPLIVILILYWKIYQVARKRIRRKPGDNAPVVRKDKQTVVSEGKRCDGAGVSSSSNVATNADGGNGGGGERAEESSTSAPAATSTTSVTIVTITPAMKAAADLRKERERKAAKTLAIITGVFIVCWLPFFVLTLLVSVRLLPLDVSPFLTSLFLWLGYVNSSLNPIIYTIFSPDFRNCFKKMLPCNRRRRVQHNNNRTPAAGGNNITTTTAADRVQLSTVAVTTPKF